MKRLVRTIATAGLAACVILGLTGCSSPFKAIVVNETGKPITVLIEWIDGNGNRSKEIRLEPFESKKKSVWIWESPPKFSVIARSDANEIISSSVFLASHYIPSLQERSSQGPTFRIHVRDSGIRLEEASAWESNGESWMLFGGWGLCCVGSIGTTIWLIVLSIRRAKTPQAAIS